MPRPIQSKPPNRSRFLARLLQRRGRAAGETLVGPLRGELLGAEGLAARARAIAKAQRLADPAVSGRRPLLLARLASTSKILEDAHARLTITADAGRDVGPAGEWLLDNFHVVREQIQEVRDSLPAKY